MKALTLLATLLGVLLAPSSPAKTPDGKQKLILIAGKPSHPPGMHEFRAGSLLLQKRLAPVEGLVVEVHDGGWVKDEKTLDEADAIVIYADGNKGHPAVQGDHLARLDALARRGVGIGMMHYGVEVVPEQAGAELKRWIGGHYEHMFSCNPLWEPSFTVFPEHAVTRGVKPFNAKDEWYFNIRFAGDFSADAEKSSEGVKFTPLLVAKPGDDVRAGPYVYPKGPYPHIIAARGRQEAMMWAVERPDGGRGFGFTGGHFHNNWGNDNFRKAILNALVWLAKVEVPATGVESSVSPDELKANLDPKGSK